MTNQPTTQPETVSTPAPHRHTLINHQPAQYSNPARDLPVTEQPTTQPRKAPATHTPRPEITNRGPFHTGSSP